VYAAKADIIKYQSSKLLFLIETAISERNCLYAKLMGVKDYCRDEWLMLVASRQSPVAN
jgi:hypothetical protein